VDVDLRCKDSTGSVAEFCANSRLLDQVWVVRSTNHDRTHLSQAPVSVGGSVTGDRWETYSVDWSQSIAIRPTDTKYPLPDDQAGRRLAAEPTLLIEFGVVHWPFGQTTEAIELHKCLFDRSEAGCW